jgi:hypothetical protein
MAMRSIHGAALVFAATLAATVGSPGPAKAFFFLPIMQQSQPSFDSRSGRIPGDNNRWKSDRGRDEAAQPKSSTGTRVKRDEEKSSSSGKSGKSQAKSESSSSQASRTRSVRQEPPPSKSSGRANASVRRESPAGGGSTPPAPQPAQASEPSTSARVGNTLGDTFDEKLGEVFKSRIDEIIKQSN